MKLISSYELCFGNNQPTPLLDDDSMLHISLSHVAHIVQYTATMSSKSRFLHWIAISYTISPYVI